VASDGGVFSFGDAGYFGSTGAIKLNKPIVGMGVTPNGKGYWLVASDGGIFAFGDAGYFGSTGATALSSSIVGMAASPDGSGYWLVASDGGVFTFGDAGYFGSTGAIRLNKPIVGTAATPDGEGYWLFGSDGGVFTFGDAGYSRSASVTGKSPTRTSPSGASTTGAAPTSVTPTGTTPTDGSPTGATSIGATSATLPSFGVNLSALSAVGDWWQKAFREYAEAGSTWVRVTVAWPSLEPSPGVFSPSYLISMENVVSTASSMGMSVLFLVIGTPAWDQPPNQSGAADVAVPGGNLPPVNDSDYAAAMAEVAGQFAGQKVAWEIWNEPNNAAFFSSISPSAYAQLACSAYAAIKAVAPDATVVAGALSEEDPIWLGRAFTAGLGGCFDVLSLHPYDPMTTPEPANWEPPVSVAADRQIMVAYGDADKDIWITEFGWAADPVTTDPIPASNVTLTNQATYTTNFINEIAASYPYVTAVMIFNGVDTSGGMNPFDEYAGILTPSLAPKPVYEALSSLYQP
jgi:hypothetical protein